MNKIIILIILFSVACFAQVQKSSNPFRDWVSVTQYNAKPDDGVSDSAAFAQAIATGKNVSFPDGVFIVGRLTLGNQQDFVGAGFGSILQPTDYVDTLIIAVGGFIGNFTIATDTIGAVSIDSVANLKACIDIGFGVSNTRLSNIKIWYPYSAQDTVVGIGFSSASNSSYLDRMFVYGCNVGLRAGGSFQHNINVTNSRFLNNTIHNVLLTTDPADGASTSRSWSFTNTDFENSTTGACIRVERETEISFQNVHFENGSQPDLSIENTCRVFFDGYFSNGPYSGGYAIELETGLSNLYLDIANFTWTEATSFYPPIENYDEYKNNIILRTGFQGSITAVTKEYILNIGGVEYLSPYVSFDYLNKLERTILLANTGQGFYEDHRNSGEATSEWHPVISKNDTMIFAQATGGNQPKDSINIKNGHSALYFDANDYMEIGDASDWTFLHETNSQAILWVGQIATGDTSVLLTTVGEAYSADTTKIGMSLFWADDTVYFHTFTGLSGEGYTLEYPFAGGWAIIVLTSKHNTQYASMKINDGDITDGTWSNVYSASDPETPLRIGNDLKGNIGHLTYLQIMKFNSSAYMLPDADITEISERLNDIYEVY